MSCKACNEGACALTVGAMLGGGAGSPAGVVGETGWPASLGVNHPAGAATTAAGEAPAAISSNCMFAGPNFTACQIGTMQTEHRVDMYEFTGEIGDGIGSPYTTGAFMWAIPTERLTACFRVSQVRIAVFDASAAAYVLGSATDGVPVTKGNARSAWHTQENGAEVSVSVSTGARAGRDLVTTDSNCNCATLDGWAPYDLPGQLEVQIPNAIRNILVDGDRVTIYFQVDRTYIAAASCELPERCGQTEYAYPV